MSIKSNFDNCTKIFESKKDNKDNKKNKAIYYIKIII